MPSLLVYWYPRRCRTRTGRRRLRRRPRVPAVRTVAAHHDLAAKEAAGTFRRDLYYRLATHQVRIPPLRERKSDIGLLLEHFLAAAASELGKKKPTAPRELAVLLSTYAFP